MNDELRELIREVIRDVLPKGLPVTETVNLSTDEDLAAFPQMLRADFAQAGEGHNRVPFSPFLLRTALVGEGFIRSDPRNS